MHAAAAWHAQYLPQGQQVALHLPAVQPLIQPTASSAHHPTAPRQRTNPSVLPRAVVRYDLEYLGLCPCMVDVEIIDAKNDNQSIFVSAGPEACSCHRLPPPPLRALQDPALMAARVAANGGGAGYFGGMGGMPGMGGVPGGYGGSGMGGAPGRGPDSPKRSGSGMSQLFDALVMAATGGPDGAAAAALGGEPPVDSRLAAGNAAAQQAAAAAAAAALGAAAPLLMAAAAGAAVAPPPIAAAAAAAPPPRQHNLPSRQRSRLWSALSYGDVDSLQNALDAFRAEDEIASGGPALSDALGAAEGGFRKRQRKPVRGPSSGNLAQLDKMDSGLLGSLLKGSGISGLREKSADNAPGLDVGGGGAADAGEVNAPASGAVAGSQPAEGGADSDAQARACDANGRAAEADVDAETDGPLECGVGVGEGEGEAGGADDEGEEGGGGGEDDLGADGGAGGDGDPALGLLPRRVRHVPRQSSAINLATRVSPAEVKRLAVEVEGLRQENVRLELALRRSTEVRSGRGWVAAGAAVLGHWCAWLLHGVELRASVLSLLPAAGMCSMYGMRIQYMAPALLLARRGA